MITFVSRHRYSFLLGLSIFLFIFIFFTQVHPVYPYDADDWTYLYRWRDAYPTTSQYNPTRVLPEVLTPICGELAMVLIYPFVGNVTLSLCILTSIVLASAIAIYILLFYKMLQQTLCLQRADSFVLSLLFFAFHFFWFAKYNSENQHLFYSFDLCCHYNYTIPNIIASSFVLLFIINKYEYYNVNKQYIQRGFFLLCLYLIVFSHLFESIILIAYLGVLLLFQLLAAPKTKSSFYELSRKYRLHISIIISWLIALCFEAGGRRAQAVQDIAQQSFVDALIESTKNFVNLFVNYTNTFANILLLTVFAIFAFYKYKKHSAKSFCNLAAMLLTCAIVCCIYVILMAAKSYPYYILRLMTVYSVPFFILLSGFICMGAIVRQNRKFVIVIPFIILLICSKMEHRGDTFLDVQTMNIKQEIQGIYKVSPEEIISQNDKLIGAIIDADKQGLKETTIVVNKYNHVDNWPLAFYYGKRLSEFLYKYGIIENRIKVNVLPQEINSTSKINGGTDGH